MATPATELDVDGIKVRLTNPDKPYFPKLGADGTKGKLVGYVVADELALPPRDSLDHPDAAAGQTRVDAEHAHHGPPLPHVRVFDTLIRGGLAPGTDTPRR